MEELTLDALIEKIKSDDPDVRTDAWQAAGGIGAPAFKPLAKIAAEGELEVSRAAKRAMWQIVRTVGAPGRDECKKAAETELIGLLDQSQPDSIRCEVLWMLSEVGGDRTIEAIREIPGILENPRLREDARCAIERIPGEYAVDTLRESLESAPDEFKLAMAQSLRARGVKVDQERYPCQKLVPTKETSVKPVAK